METVEIASFIDTRVCFRYSYSYGYVAMFTMIYGSLVDHRAISVPTLPLPKSQEAVGWRKL